MANYQIDLAKIVYQKVFGYYKIPKIISKPQPFELNSNQYGTELYKYDDYGIKMFTPVTLIFGNEEITLPYSTISITGRKNIVSTPLINGRGSVHEKISLNDYEFSVNGVVIERNELLPEFWLEKLNLIFETDEAMEIINPVTDFYLKEDQNVIVTGHSLPDMKGVEGAQAYSFKLKSDVNLELIIE